MKKLSILILTMIIAASVMAQVKLDLILSATPPANLTEWGNRREVMTVIVSPGPGLALQFKIKAVITASDGSEAGTNDLTRAQVFALQSTPLILTAMDVIPVENMIFNGKYKTSLNKTGKLPADNYTLCLTPVRPVDLTPMSNPVCKSFYLATTQLPVLMKPYDGEILGASQAQTAITFRWSPVSPRTTALVTYRIQVFEVLQNQTPMQALRANQPLLDQELRGATQYIWRPQLSFNIIQDGNCEEKEFQDRKVEVSGDAGAGNNNKSNKCKYRFIWTIQTLDDHGLPITQTDGNGEARSEPVIFYVDPNKNKSSGNSSKKKGHIKVIKDTTGNGGG